MMAKAVFRSAELSVLTDSVILNSPTSYSELASLARQEEEVQEEAPIEVYTGPTAEDLRREAEEFKSRWASEREQMIEAAKAEAEGIVLRARENAAREMHNIEENAESLKSKAREEAEQILAEARQKAGDMETETRSTLDAERNEVLEKGREEGRSEGYA